MSGGRFRCRFWSGYGGICVIAAQASGVEVLRTEAGWCAILRLPQVGDAEVAEELLRRADVVVHPGSFYGIAERGRVVVSLLGPAKEFADGIGRIVAAMGEPR